MSDKIDIATERLRIRHFRLGDLDACLRFQRQVFRADIDRAAVEKWLSWTIDSYRELAQLGQPPYADYAVELRENGAFIGSAGIVPTVVPWGAIKGNADDRLLTPEIGLFWGISTDHRRRGYASQAAAALMRYLFDDFGARQIVATTEHDNIASQGVMTKLGMTLHRNPSAEPAWCQVIGLSTNPRARGIRAELQ